MRETNRGKQVEQEILDYIRKWDMLKEQNKVIVGVSGGADSVCLLLVLHTLEKTLKISLSVVHINHALRGTAADADEQFVRELCKSLKLPFESYCFPVKQLAKKWHVSTEEAGRLVRREALMKAMQKQGAAKIALAHHADDNAETLFLNLCRGTGLSGLCGMQPVNGVFIRPLLQTRRGEIENYIKQRNVAFCEDITNEEDDYTRNRIRHHVLPYLEEQINAKSVEHISETMTQLRMVQTYLMEHVQKHYEHCCSETKEGVQIYREEFWRLSELLRTMVLKQALEKVSGQAKDLEKKHIQMLVDLMENQTGRQGNFPYGVLATRNYEGIYLTKQGRKNMGKTEKKEAEGMEKKEGLFRMEILSRSQIEGKPWEEEKIHTKYLDYDIIKDTVEIRTRKTGDYITIDPSGKKQTMKAFFINRKIPKEQRDCMPLVVCRQHVLWIPGYRISSICHIKNTTEKVLKIQWIEGEKDGREH